MNKIATWMANNYAKTGRGPKTRTGGLSPKQAALIISRALKKPISKDAVYRWQNGSRTTPTEVIEWLEKQS